MASLQKYFDDIPNAPPAESVLNFMLYDFFRYRHFKNTIQRKATVEIVKRKSDVIVSLPKGYGRTMSFTLPILICKQKVSIIFVALSSRIKVQANRLIRKNINVEILSTKTTADEWMRINNNLYNVCKSLSSQNNVLYVTHDLVSNDNFLNLMNFLIGNNNLGYIVVDETYCENGWILGEKEEYHALCLLRNAFIHIPWIVATADANSEVINCIKTALCLRTQRPDLPRDSIPWFKPNLFYNDVLLDR